MKTFLNRFFYWTFIASGIWGTGLIVIAIFAIHSWMLFISGCLNYFLFCYLFKIGYEKFEFQRFDEEFESGFYVLSPEPLARFTEANQILDKIIIEWQFLSLSEKQELRHSLRILKNSEENLAPLDQIFPLLENKIAKHNIYF